MAVAAAAASAVLPRLPRLLLRCALLTLALALTPAAALRAAPPVKEEDAITLEFALYFAPKPSADPEKEIARLVAEPARKLGLISQPAAAGDYLAWIGWKSVPLADYAPPSAASLRYTAIGVPESLAGSLAQADRVLTIGLIAGRRDALAANRAACSLVADLAAATGGYPWDEETRQLFSRERWRIDRVENWQDGLPDLKGQITMHAYAAPDLIRIITLGLRKFGLPDLVVTNIPREHSAAAGNLVNCVAQRLVEGQSVTAGKLDLRLADTRHPAARIRALANPGTGAHGAVTLTLSPVAPEEGDPRNTLWKLDFPASGLKAYTERVLWGANELFGSTDRMSKARGDDAAMAAAREKARSAFFAREALFRAGLPFGEHLLVKGPFTSDGQTEYMWVEITKWGPDYIEGILANDPFYVKTLHSGSRVRVTFADIYDYIWRHADGTQEGNESGKVLEKRERGR